jgi:hypothetical protein
MSEAKGVNRFFHGFATAAMGLGILLGLAWLAFWGLEAVGGPDLRMPMRLLQSAGGLILIGYILRLLLGASAAQSRITREGV